MSAPKRIERLYAWVVTDADGEDGIPAVHSAALRMPVMAIGADRERIESYRVEMEGLAAEGFRVRLVEFSAMTTLELLPLVPGKGRPPHR